MAPPSWLFQVQLVLPPIDSTIIQITSILCTKAKAPDTNTNSNPTGPHVPPAMPCSVCFVADNWALQAASFCFSQGPLKGGRRVSLGPSHPSGDPCGSSTHTHRPWGFGTHHIPGQRPSWETVSRTLPHCLSIGLHAGVTVRPLSSVIQNSIPDPKHSPELPRAP